MPFDKENAVDQRMRFVALAVRPDTNFTALCRRFGISRTTGYRWLNRYQETGALDGLVDRSRAPHHSPHKTPPEIEARVVALRRESGWGARRLVRLLEAEGIELPVSTINRILQRHGLIEQGGRPQRHGRLTPTKAGPMADGSESNAEPLSPQAVLDRAFAEGDAASQVCIVTGGRGAGKSTWCGALAREARGRGLQVAGVWSPGAFTGDEKTGIDLVDLSTDLVLWLATLWADEAAPVANGKWVFDPDVFVWGNQVLAAVDAPDLLIVDELGPLEFERGQGLTEGLALLDAGRYRLACVVIRPELLDTARARWPGAWIVTPPRGEGAMLRTRS